MKVTNWCPFPITIKLIVAKTEKVAHTSTLAPKETDDCVWERIKTPNFLDPGFRVRYIPSVEELKINFEDFTDGDDPSKAEIDQNTINVGAGYELHISKAA